MRYSGQDRRPGRAVKRAVWIAAGAIALFFVIAGIALAIEWPFSRESVTRDLAEAAKAKVTISDFRTTYLPPGFIAKGVHLDNPQTGAMIVRADELRVRATYLGMLRKQLRELSLTGFDVQPGAVQLSNSEGGGASKSGSSRTTGSIHISKLIARHGSIELGAASSGGQPFGLNIDQLVLGGLGGSRLTFELAAGPRRLRGQFRARGTIGPFDSKSFRTAPVSGRYAYSGADLADAGGVSGILSSTGKIGGTIGGLEFDGTADVPDFQVRGTGHKVDLKSDFAVIVNASDATIDLRQIRSSFERTTILAHGRIEKDKSKPGKTLELSADVKQGRIDDLLRLFSSAPRPGMTGPVTLNGSIELPPGSEAFLRRLKLDGSFEITDALFTNPKTQSSLNHLSESSGGESRAEERRNGSEIPGKLRGTVHDSDAIARLSQVQYTAPGISAALNGTFNLISRAVDLKGLLATTGKLSDATSVFKSLLLDVARPFLAIRHSNKTTIVAFSISGTSKHPVFALSRSKRAHLPNLAVR